jgi:ABC-type glycerol-3-phosphate transport system substrate-binding protein
MRAYTLGEAVFGLPQSTDAPVLLFNKAQYRRAGLRPATPPKTIDQLIQACDRLGRGRGLALYTSFGYLTLPWIWAFGGATINPAKRQILISQPEAEAGLGTYATIYRSTCVSRPDDGQDAEEHAIDSFREGRVAQVVTGPWHTARVLGWERVPRS